MITPEGSSDELLPLSVLSQQDVGQYQVNDTGKGGTNVVGTTGGGDIVDEAPLGVDVLL